MGRGAVLDTDANLEGDLCQIGNLEAGESVEGRGCREGGGATSSGRRIAIDIGLGERNEAADGDAAVARDHVPRFLGGVGTSSVPGQTSGAIGDELERRIGATEAVGVSRRL